MKKTKRDSAENLIGKIKEGDIYAFQQLVDSYKDVSFSLACSILKDDHLAEDALQDAFIKIFKSIKSYKGNSSFSTWLYRIVVNTCFTVQKKQQRQPEKLGDQEVRCITDKTYDTLEAKERREIINKALNFLKPDESLLLQLYYLSELSVKEIKEVTKFKDSKIKVTLHRGRKNLEEVLQKMLGGELKQLL